MFKGTVTFPTRIKSDGVRFPLVAFNPNLPRVDKVEIEAPNGYEIHATVHLTSVASSQEGRELAAKVHMAALDRIAFNHSIGLETPRRTGEQYWPPTEVNAFADVSTRFGLVLGIEATQVKTELEQVSPPGEQNYGLFRSARQSLSPAEEFMHLYHILLMIYNDKQKAVDAFIISEDPAVPQTQHPLKKPGLTETVYTRLRNELAHKRAGVNLDNTKSEMANRLGGLIALTKRAIELHP
jgi:hypothetical protein